MREERRGGEALCVSPTLSDTQIGFYIIALVGALTPVNCDVVFVKVYK